MRGSSGHDVMTQIVQMENPDGITSDVQVTGTINILQFIPIY